MPPILRSILPALATLLAATATAGADEYYVDSGDPAASDDNPGTEAAPWRTCPGMSGWAGSATLEPGDVVFFRNDATWTASHGQVVLDATGGVTYDGRAWGPGERAILRAEGPLQRSVVNVWEDHPTSPTVIRGFEVDAGGQVTSGIGVNWPWYQSGLTGATKSIQDCLVHGVQSRSAAGEYEYGIIVSTGGAGNDVLHVEVLDSVVHDVSRGGINLYPGNDTPDHRIEDLLVRGNLVYDVGTDPDYAGCALGLKNHVVDAVVEYNVVRDAANGSGMCIGSHETGGFRTAEDAVLRHNVVSGMPHMGILIYQEAAGPSDAGIRAALVGNVVTGNTYGGIVVMAAYGPSELQILNNTLVGNRYPDWSAEIWFWDVEADFTTLEVYDNLLVADAGTVPLEDDGAAITGHGGNFFARDGGGTLAEVAGQPFGEADLASYEPDGRTGDPLLRNPAAPPTAFTGTWGEDLEPDPDGFAPSEGSPLLDAGVALDAAWTTSINSVTRPAGAGWDIGAWEVGIPDDDDTGRSDSAGDDGEAGGGCACGTAHGSLPATLLAATLLALVRRSRRGASVRRQVPARP